MDRQLALWIVYVGSSFDVKTTTWSSYIADLLNHGMNKKWLSICTRFTDDRVEKLGQEE
jgi:hypothetical protein